MKPHLNHPLIGKICQYKPEHYGKVIFSWHKPEDKLHETKWERHIGWIHNVMRPCSQDDSLPAIIWNARIQRIGAGAAPPPAVTQESVFYDTKSVAPNIPWAFNMPWGWLTGINHIDVIPSPEFSSKEGRAKIILNPCEAVTFKAKIGTIEVGTTSYLKCLVTNPRDEDPKPRFLWIKDTWISPHTGLDSYDEDFKESFQKRWLRKLREGKEK